MFDTPERLLEKIQLGEDSLLECKAVVFAGSRVRSPSRDDLADELAAAANSTRACVFVLGVDDSTHEILGIPRDRLDAAETYVRELCNDSITPPLMVPIERLVLPDTDGTERAVLRVDVEPGLFVHQSPGGFYYRIGSSKRRMAADYLARLQQQRSQARLIRFDEQIVRGTSPADLAPDLVARFRSDLTEDDDLTLARKLAIVRDGDDGRPCLTVAGVLLGTRRPQTWLPHAFVQAVAYRGRELDAGPGYQQDAADLEGPLDEQIFEACRFVRRNMRVAASKSTGRQDLPQFDETAIFEALVNAVAHRDYSIHGAKIRLRLFADRFELYSPGALPNTMTVESILLRQVTRNEVICSLLAKIPVSSAQDSKTTNISSRSTIMDRRGEGAPLIFRRSERLSGKRPVYCTPDESELLLTIPGAAPEDGGAD